MDLCLGHLVEVLQVRVEEVAADKLHAQHGLDDVANGAVIRKTHSFCSTDEITQAVRAQETRSNTL